MKDSTRYEGGSDENANQSVDLGDGTAQHTRILLLPKDGLEPRHRALNDPGNWSVDISIL